MAIDTDTSLKNVLVVGSGGREHAIVRALRRSERVGTVYCCPGNAGIAEEAILVGIDPDSVRGLEALERFLTENAVDLTVIGPEKYLEAGIVDYLESRGHRVFGTLKQASKLESSKRYAKEFMIAHDIPTAHARVFYSPEQLRAYLDDARYPAVLKADGLAAGKGVVIAADRREAEESIGFLFGLSAEVLVEDYLTGTEASIMCFVDNDTIRIMQPARDYKKAYDGDRGPNTGGMGCFSPDMYIPSEVMRRFESEVAQRFMHGIKREKIDFRGVLFVGIMYDRQGSEYRLNVLEFNTRFGDPETEVTLPRLRTDLYDVLSAVAENRLRETELEWTDEFAVLVVLAAEGYPASPRKGDRISASGGAMPEHTIHFGTRKAQGSEGVLETAGGRVLGAMGFGGTLEEAQSEAYRRAGEIRFAGMHYRKDIAGML